MTPRRVRLAGGPAAGYLVWLPLRHRVTVWVTVLDGAAHVLDLDDPKTARELLNRASGWHEYVNAAAGEDPPRDQWEIRA